MKIQKALLQFPFLHLPLLAIPLLLLPSGCRGESESDTKAAGQESSQNATTERQRGPIEGEYKVQCGCEIDSIGACGNYVHVGDHPYEIKGDLGLGVMEWCGQGGHQATVKGILQDSDFYGESIAVLPSPDSAK